MARMDLGNEKQMSMRWKFWHKWMSPPRWQCKVISYFWLASAEKSVKKRTQFFSECKTGMRSSKFVFYGSREPTQKMITKEREQQRRPRLIQFCFSCTNFVCQASTESGRFELQASSVTTKKSPNVYKKWSKTDFTRIMKDFDTFSKLPKMWRFGRNNCCYRLRKVAQS